MMVVVYKSAIARETYIRMKSQAPSPHLNGQKKTIAWVEDAEEKQKQGKNNKQESLADMGPEMVIVF